jgi:hypothetical protein
VGVTWELVGLAMGQVAAKWNTTDERRVLERVRVLVLERGSAGKEGDTGRRAQAQWAGRGRGWWETGGLDAV